MKFDIVCFGSAVADTFVETGLPENKKAICYPSGDKILIKNSKIELGGGGLNTSVAFARFGLKTALITAVGDDANGEKIQQKLKQEKIKFLGKIDKKEITGYSVVLDSKEKDRTILTYKGA